MDSKSKIYKHENYDCIGLHSSALLENTAVCRHADTGHIKLDSAQFAPVCIYRGKAEEVQNLSATSDCCALNIFNKSSIVQALVLACVH